MSQILPHLLLDVGGQESPLISLDNSNSHDVIKKHTITPTCLLVGGSDLPLLLSSTAKPQIVSTRRSSDSPGRTWEKLRSRFPTKVWKTYQWYPCPTISIVSYLYVHIYIYNIHIYIYISINIIWPKKTHGFACYFSGSQNGFRTKNVNTPAIKFVSVGSKPWYTCYQNSWAGCSPPESWSHS